MTGYARQPEAYRKLWQIVEAQVGKWPRWRQQRTGHRKNKTENRSLNGAVLVRRNEKNGCQDGDSNAKDIRSDETGNNSLNVAGFVHRHKKMVAHVRTSMSHKSDEIGGLRSLSDKAVQDWFITMSVTISCVGNVRVAFLVAAAIGDEPDRILVRKNGVD